MMPEVYVVNNFARFASLHFMEVAVTVNEPLGRVHYSIMQEKSFGLSLSL